MSTRAVIAALRQLCVTARSCTWKSATDLEIVLSESVSFTALREFETCEVFASMPEQTVQRVFNEARAGEVPAGGTVVLQVPRLLDRLVVAEGLSDLLTVAGTQMKEPHAYLLVASRSDGEPFSYVRGDVVSGAPATIWRYHEAIRLWSLLERQAEHVDSSSGSLLFFGLRRTEISPGFGADDLTDQIAVQEIEAFVANPDRKATRAEIFAAALSEFLRDQSNATAFRVLLRDTGRFARRLREGLAIYLAEHSPEKLAGEAKSAALTLSEKLEKVIGGLETKSLSIPAALLLAVKDVEAGAGITGINVIIIAAALTYGVTMTLVHWSQSALIAVIKNTITLTEREFVAKGLDERNPVITSNYQSLKERCVSALIGSRAMVIGSWVPLLCVIGTMGWGTPKPPAMIPANAATTAIVSAPANTVPAAQPPLVVPISLPPSSAPSGNDNK